MCNWFKKKKKFKITKYNNSILYKDCVNLLSKNKFLQTGDYCFSRKLKHENRLGLYSYRYFFLYHFYTEGITLNIYYPQESFILIKDLNDMQKQIDRFKNEL